MSFAHKNQQGKRRRETKPLALTIRCAQMVVNRLAKRLKKHANDVVPAKILFVFLNKASQGFRKRPTTRVTNFDRAGGARCFSVLWHAALIDPVGKIFCFSCASFLDHSYVCQRQVCYNAQFCVKRERNQGRCTYRTVFNTYVAKFSL